MQQTNSYQIVRRGFGKNSEQNGPDWRQKYEHLYQKDGKTISEMKVYHEQVLKKGRKVF